MEDVYGLEKSRVATHKVFGIAQTINSANYSITEALDEARHMDCPHALEIVLGMENLLYLSLVKTDIEQGGLLDIQVGQSYRLHWTRHAACPSEQEYFEMVHKSKNLKSIVMIELTL